MILISSKNFTKYLVQTGFTDFNQKSNDTNGFPCNEHKKRHEVYKSLWLD